MLSRHFRFQGLGSVRAAMNHGLTTRAGLFTIKHLLRHNRSSPRAGVIVSRKTAKHATTRNRIRRRVYAQLLANWSTISEPVDIIVIVHDKRLADMPETELSHTFARALKRSFSASHNSK